MLKFIFVVTLAIFFVSEEIQARTFSREQLKTELRRYNFPENQLNDWVCLVFAESSGRTDVKHKNNDGSVDYGLFQINNRYWCSETGSPGKDCKVRCADLLTDDISKAAQCAKIIYKRHGFKAWYGWQNKCQ